jgi:uncharacterized protein (TIGR00369 family)
MSEFEPAHPDYEASVRAMFDSQAFMAHLGATLGAIAPGRAEIRLPFRREHTQQDGYVHGGIIATLADNACGAACYTLLPRGQGVLTVEFKVNLLAPAWGEALLSRGAVLKPGRTLFVCRAEVLACRGEALELCAIGMMTARVVRPGAGRRGR